MKPFNLEDALAGKPVMLRDGKKAYVRHHETKLSVGLIGFRTDGYMLSWCVNGDYCPLDAPAAYDIIGMYPETRIINGFEVPAPETEVPASFTDYFITTPTLFCLYGYETWSGHRIHRMWLERGLVFLNKEDAIATAKAMLGIDPNSKEEP